MLNSTTRIKRQSEQLHHKKTLESWHTGIIGQAGHNYKPLSNNIRISNANNTIISILCQCMPINTYLATSYTYN